MEELSREEIVKELNRIMAMCMNRNYNYFEISSALYDLINKVDV